MLSRLRSRRPSPGRFQMLPQTFSVTTYWIASDAVPLARLMARSTNSSLITARRVVKPCSRRSAAEGPASAGRSSGESDDAVVVVVVILSALSSRGGVTARLVRHSPARALTCPSRLAFSLPRASRLRSSSAPRSSAPRSSPAPRASLLPPGFGGTTAGIDRISRSGGIKVRGGVDKTGAGPGEQGRGNRARGTGAGEQERGEPGRGAGAGPGEQGRADRAPGGLRSACPGHLRRAAVARGGSRWDPDAVGATVVPLRRASQVGRRHGARTY